jgi:polyphosphate kinase 2 (PPK2 family)
LSREQFEVGDERLHKSSSLKSPLEEISTFGRMLTLTSIIIARFFLNDPRIRVATRIRELIGQK